MAFPSWEVLSSNWFYHFALAPSTQAQHFSQPSPLSRYAWQPRSPTPANGGSAIAFVKRKIEFRSNSAGVGGIFSNLPLRPRRTTRRACVPTSVEAGLFQFACISFVHVQTLTCAYRYQFGTSLVLVGWEPTWEPTQYQLSTSESGTHIYTSYLFFHEPENFN